MVLKKFEENLIKLSKKNTWEEASKEWGFLYKRERDTRDNHCLCGIKLKHQHYYYNKNTKKIICAGKACRKHIDDYRGNKKYNSDFISDLYSLGHERVVDYDLEEYCRENEQRVFDRFFWRIEALVLEKQLNFYYEYIEEYWSDLLNVDVILERIKEKLQMIVDREEGEKQKKEERIRLARERERLKVESLLKLKHQKEEEFKQNAIKQKLEEKYKQLEYKKELFRFNKELSIKKKEVETLEHKIMRLQKKIKKSNCCNALFVCNC